MIYTVNLTLNSVKVDIDILTFLNSFVFTDSVCVCGQISAINLLNFKYTFYYILIGSVDRFALLIR